MPYFAPEKKRTPWEKTLGKNLYEKVFAEHKVQSLPSGEAQLFIGLHLVHEVTSPQAFAELKERGLPLMCPERTFATADHIIPTTQRSRPLQDPLAEEMLQALEANTAEFGITYFDLDSGHQGIVHVVGPEQGLTQPGMTIACGDSHTATHGAFGAIAFGIGTTQVRDVLATQTLVMTPLKVRKIEITGSLQKGVGAKDVILYIIKTLGARGGIGYAYEYCGDVVRGMTMEERMTLCNMSIEGGARCGYVNPDAVTIEYLRNRPYCPANKEEFDQLALAWLSYASDADAEYDDVVVLRGEDIPPMVTFGVSPDQAMGIDERIPEPGGQEGVDDALRYMKLKEGSFLKGQKIDVAFIGSCTNGRLSDFEAVAPYLKGQRVAAHVRAIAVPGSQIVDAKAREAGIADIFEASGFEWRSPGCSMCLAMNPDKLHGDEVCASTSNRNFKGRQGSPNGRTLLMSPLMVAASAIKGEVCDPREVFSL